MVLVVWPGSRLYTSAEDPLALSSWKKGLAVHTAGVGLGYAEPHKRRLRRVGVVVSRL